MGVYNKKFRKCRKISDKSSARIRNLFSFHKSVVVRGHHLFILAAAAVLLKNFIRTFLGHRTKIIII